MSNQRPSTLFAPSTPRSSPTLPPVTSQISSTPFRSSSRAHSTTDDHGSSFISVSANEDPLSLSLNPSLDVPTTFEWDNKTQSELLSTPLLIPELSSTLAPLATSSQPSHQPTRTDNPSLTFFDKFAQKAKRNSELRRKGLMDELLKCEDDPLYFLHNGIERSPLKKKENHQEDQGETFDSPTPDPELQKPSPSLLPPVDTVLHDLDQDYFSSGRLVPVDINTHNDIDKTISEQRLSSSLHTRSPSQPSPPTLAPPIMDSDISSDLHTLSDDSSSRNDLNPSLSSSSTFSTRTRWMSNLLKTSGGTGQQHQGQAVTSTLESILGVNADASSSSSHPTSATSSASTVSAIQRRNSSTLPIRHRHQTPHQQPHASHTLPRSVVIKHMASPFGSHSYIPPSGAPGFRGESYDWDKGFSNELEKEIVQGKSSVTGNGNGESSNVDDKRRLVENEMQYTRPGIGIGALMEKKTGNLEMKGRRASTSPVLSQNLANLVCNIFFFIFLKKKFHHSTPSFKYLVTRVSPCPLSSSSILDSSLFTRPTWNIFKHFIHTMRRSFITFPSYLSE